jgi:hypothetical protein
VIYDQVIDTMRLSGHGSQEEEKKLKGKVIIESATEL